MTEEYKVECIKCGAQFSKEDVVYTCRKCGGLLDIKYDYEETDGERVAYERERRGGRHRV